MALDPYRYVPGETSAQRQLRIRQELSGRVKRSDVTPDMAAYRFVNPLVRRDFIGGGTEQGGNEPDIVHGIRNTLTAPFRWFADAIAPDKTRADLVETPNQRAAKAQAAQASAVFGGGTPNSYKDPLWDQLEAKMAAEVGVPLEVLRAVRLRGEMSNNDEVSEKGARSPYQIIPSTRAGIKKNYGFDPLSGPENMVRGAAVLLKESAQRNGGDWRAAVREYHGGTDPAGWGPRTNAYVDRVFSAGGMDELGVEGLVNPFDPTYGNKALAEVDKATQAQLTPQTFTFERPPAPEMPEPLPMQKTDFSQADAALQNLRPEEMTFEEKRATQMRGYFQGIGQAMMNIPDGAGLGQVLMMMGGGALAGRGAADQEIEAKMERFEKRMHEFNVAVYNHEAGKAQTIAAEANADIQQMNAFAHAKWQDAKAQWLRDNSFTATEQGFVSTSVDENGNLVVKTTPNKAAILAAGALNRANIFGQMGSQQNSGNSMVASANNSYAVAQAANAAAMLGAQDGGLEALTLGPAIAAEATVRSGRMADLFSSPEQYEAASAEVKRRMEALGFTEAAGLTQDKNYTEQLQEQWSNFLLEYALSPDAPEEFTSKLFQFGQPQMVRDQLERVRDRRSSTTRDSRGRVTQRDTGPVAF